jgi:hypothetical protein
VALETQGKCPPITPDIAFRLRPNGCAACRYSRETTARALYPSGRSRVDGVIDLPIVGARVVIVGHADAPRRGSGEL